mgnify:CR=1 FL=1
MPLEQILELVHDKPELAQEIKDWADKASVVDTIKANNLDLTRQREAWEAEKKGMSSQLDALKKSGSGNSPEFLQLKEQLDSLIEKNRLAEERASKAESDKRATELRNEIVGASASRSHNPNQVVTLMISEGLVGHGEDGKPFFHRVNDAGQAVKARNAEEAVTAFLKSNPHLEKSSGSQGSGRDIKSPGASGNGLLADPTSLL